MSARRRRPHRRAFWPTRSGRTSTSLTENRPRLPHYRVILHRTVDKELPFIVRILRDVTHFADAEATFRMWEAYRTGRSVVLVTHQERAELFVELFGERGLVVTAEPI